MRPLALVLALGAMCAPRVAHGRTEIVVGGGLVSPRVSEYRAVTEALGYDRRDVRVSWELEAGALHAVTYWLSLGPLARFQYATLDPPYTDVQPITTFGASIAARVEADLYPSPRLFVWADPSYGIGSVGVPDRRMSNTFWGVRGGIGLGTARGKASVRFRIGYAYSPTTDMLSQWAGTFDYGGWLFQLDGVLRVLP